MGLFSHTVTNHIQLLLCIYTVTIYVCGNTEYKCAVSFNNSNTINHFNNLNTEYNCSVPFSFLSIFCHVRYQQCLSNNQLVLSNLYMLLYINFNSPVKVLSRKFFKIHLTSLSQLGVHLLSPCFKSSLMTKANTQLAYQFHISWFIKHLTCQQLPCFLASLSTTRLENQSMSNNLSNSIM